MFKITDDSGFLALIDPVAYESFVGGDWTVEQIQAHFSAQMATRSLLIWGTGSEGFWNVDLMVGTANVKGFREVSGPLRVTSKALLLTNYESLTMAAQFSDVTLPEKHQENLLLQLPAGDFTCRVIQMFDPEHQEATGPGKADFVVEILPGTEDAPTWQSIPWSNVDR